MPEVRLPSAVRNTRLFRIDLPRMEIEHACLATLVYRGETEAECCVGEQTEIPTTGAWKVAAQGAHCRHWDFTQLSIRSIGDARCVGHTVEIVTDRIYTRTVRVALLFQHAKRPLIARIHGEGCSSLAADGDAADILQQPPRPADIYAKRPWVLTVSAGMIVAVTGEFVSGRDDLAHHRLVPFSYPT